MKILVYGAGVIGTLYAAKFRDDGHHVTVLARGKRLSDIRHRGLVLEDVVSGSLSHRWVDTTERLGPDDQYDLALITVRRDQLDGVVPQLDPSRGVPTLLFMCNNPMGSSALGSALGRHRVLIGFPGAGGARDRQVTRYALVPQQPTMLGELSGQRTARVRYVAGAFRAAGFPTRLSGDMDAWLKSHAIFVTAVCGAIYLAGGDCCRLSTDEARLTLMVNGVREGFAALRALGLPVTPFALRVLMNGMPHRFAVGYWRRFFASGTADYVFGNHARSAAYEMRIVADECRTLLGTSGVYTPALDQLHRAIERYAAHSA
jgi:2-dehydropantoate 2-reductase